MKHLRKFNEDIDDIDDRHNISPDFMGLAQGYPIEITTGEEENSLISDDGDVHDVTLNVIKFSKSDIYLNNAKNADVPVIFSGSIKETFIKNGVEGIENWILENGSLTDSPTNTKNNQDGNATLEYKLRFRRATRLL